MRRVLPSLDTTKHTHNYRGPDTNITLTLVFKQSFIQCILKVTLFMYIQERLGIGEKVNVCG